MSSAYKVIPIGRARPGMVLGEDLLDRYGQVLLPIGTVLTTGSLGSLVHHGLDMLPIADAPDAPEVDAVAVEARLAQLFRTRDGDQLDHWARDTLRQFVEDYRLGREVAP